MQGVLKITAFQEHECPANEHTHTKRNGKGPAQVRHRARGGIELKASERNRKHNRSEESTGHIGKGWEAQIREAEIMSYTKKKGASFVLLSVDSYVNCLLEFFGSHQ